MLEVEDLGQNSLSAVFPLIFQSRCHILKEKQTNKQLKPNISDVQGSGNMGLNRLWDLSGICSGKSGIEGDQGRCAMFVGSRVPLGQSTGEAAWGAAVPWLGLVARRPHPLRVVCVVRNVIEYQGDFLRDLKLRASKAFPHGPPCYWPRKNFPLQNSSTLNRLHQKILFFKGREEK